MCYVVELALWKFDRVSTTPNFQKKSRRNTIKNNCYTGEISSTYWIINAFLLRNSELILIAFFDYRQKIFGRDQKFAWLTL